MGGYKGCVHVCAHHVAFRYWWDGRRVKPGSSDLEAAAFDRVKEMIAEGYVSGELNCLIDGEHEVRGWWEIEKDDSDT